MSRTYQQKIEIAEEARSLHKTGLSWKQIAIMLKTSPGFVRRVVRENTWPSHSTSTQYNPTTK